MAGRSRSLGCNTKSQRGKLPGVVVIRRGLRPIYIRKGLAEIRGLYLCAERFAFRLPLQGFSDDRLTEFLIFSGERGGPTSFAILSPILARTRLGNRS